MPMYYSGQDLPPLALKYLTIILQHLWQWNRNYDSWGLVIGTVGQGKKVVRACLI